MAEDEMILDEELGEEYWKSTGSIEQDAEKSVGERGQVQVCPDE